MSKNGKFARYAALALAFTFLFGMTARAESVADLRKKQQVLQEDLAEMLEQYQGIHAEKSRIELEMENIDNELSDVETQLIRVTDELEAANELLAQKEEELAQAREEREAQYELFKERLRFMYENGSYGYLDILFKATSFSDFLNRAEYINRIAKYDQGMVERLQAAEDKVAEKLSEAEARKAEVEELLAKQTARQEELTYVLAQKQEYWDSLDADAQRSLEKSEMLEREADEIKALIKKAEDDERVRQAALAASRFNPYASSSAQVSPYTGKMSWPVSGYYNISDVFRWRSNPVNGKSEFHSGVDIPAPTGTSILAAEGGVVLWASWRSGYGNTVIIDSGNGITTLYGHNSKVVVSVGQSVAKGEVIAKAGSTGNSTGPHCHFEVRVNGSPVNPQSYLNY